jgi:hypothetical protein
MKKVLLLSLALAALLSCDTRPGKHKWSLVASPGNTRIVYLSEPAFADKTFISQVLKYLVTEGNITVVQFFDSDVFVPHSAQITDAEKLHWKARYEKNPVTGVERFHWVEIADPRAKPIVIRFVEDSIRPAP